MRPRLPSGGLGRAGLSFPAGRAPTLPAAAGLELPRWPREKSHPVRVGCRSGDGFVRDRGSGTLGEAGKGGSGHSDQPPNPAGGGDQGEGPAAGDRLKRDPGPFVEGPGKESGLKGRQSG